MLLLFIEFLRCLFAPRSTGPLITIPAMTTLARIQLTLPETYGHPVYLLKTEYKIQNTIDCTLSHSALRTASALSSARTLPFQVLMCELLTRVHPFEDSERKVHVRAIEHPRRAHRLAPGDGPISAECHDLVAQLLCKNHLERLQDWTAFKGHGWFAGLNFEDVYAKKVPIPDLCQPLAAPQPPGNSQALLATSYDGPQYSAFSWRPAAGSRPASNTIFEC